MTFKICLTQTTRCMDGKMAVLPSDSDYCFPPRFFFSNPEGKKKTNKLDSGEVGRRSYVITQKKKNDPPLSQQSI